MPSASVFLSFVTISVLFALLPGPNVVFLLATAAARGPWSAWRSALGVETATLVFVVLTASGLGAVIMASEAAFQALKWAGAGYLCWLGIQAWRAGGNRDRTPTLATPVFSHWIREFGRGFLLGIANPKVVLFFLAFLPQFVNYAGPPAWQQLLFLGTSFAVIGLVCDAAWCAAAGCVKRLVARSRPRPVVRRAPSLVYFGLAGWAAATGQRSH